MEQSGCYACLAGDPQHSKNKLFGEKASVGQIYFETLSFMPNNLQRASFFMRGETIGQI